jgi:hypothetical protein
MAFDALSLWILPGSSEKQIVDRKFPAQKRVFAILTVARNANGPGDAFRAA